MGGFDILLLSALIAATKEDDDFVTNLPEVNSVSRAKIYFQLDDTITDRFAVTEVAQFYPIDPRPNLTAAFFVSQGKQPILERLFTVHSLVVFNSPFPGLHRRRVVYKLQLVKRGFYGGGGVG